MGAVNFSGIGRIPHDGDNVAIATKLVDQGTQYVFQDHAYTLSHTVMEGHRFAIEPIRKGQPLLSWGLPFGKALRDIAPGDYICNAAMIEGLKHRKLSFALPEQPNLEDKLEPYILDEKKFRPGRQVPLHAKPGTFMGYPRTGGRGVGTRNYVVILGTTSRTASYAMALERRTKPLAKDYPNVDGIVACTHTEGGGTETPNNLDLVLRTLAGFMVNPNVGAVIAADLGSEVITNKMVEDYMQAHKYQLAHLPHRFYSLDAEFETALAEGEKTIRGFLEQANRQTRSEQPQSALRLALQCGGSDAFSGVSGNPLAGWVSKELVKNGGAANLAETDELMGAEAYILANTRDLPTARKFLGMVARFKERALWHGHSAEGNPSGGNKYRGLYNIGIKSIGAARKKDPEVTLDHVIEYGEPMVAPGYYFMDSPGNDLESMAGQVASGCNILMFTTGNGSITNFPFVPTIKVMTTTGRYNLMPNDMDINAGRYQDGEPMDKLGMESFRYTVDVASGKRSVGERAGHSQVSIWRNWRQTDGAHLQELQHRPEASGKPIPVRQVKPLDAHFRAWQTARGYAADQVGLILPTSICSTQIARRIADELNAKGLAKDKGVSRFVALLHTEGCGASGGENESHFTRTLVGHLVHPFVREGLLLEHGCEKIHNDEMRHQLEARHVDPSRFGWASVQLDGGIEKVVDKVERWFSERLAASPGPGTKEVGLEALSLGLTSVRDVPEPVARALATLAASVVNTGGTVVIPENASLLQSADFIETLFWEGERKPTLEYGQVADEAGLHIMAAPTDHAVETLTGLGGTGVQVMLAYVNGPPLQAHPMIPLVQITADKKTAKVFHKDLDQVIEPGNRAPEQIADEVLHLVLDVASRSYQPKLFGQGSTDFQVTRGFLGISM